MRHGGKRRGEERCSEERRGEERYGVERCGHFQKSPVGCICPNPRLKTPRTGLARKSGQEVPYTRRSQLDTTWTKRQATGHLDK